MPRKSKKNKSGKDRCKYCGKEILLALDITKHTWIHAHSGEAFSQDIVPHIATPRSKKQS